MTIELIPITKDYFPKEEGYYLIKSISTSNYPFKKPHFLEAKLTISTDSKGKKSYAIDINNQIALEISSKPIR